MSWWNDFVGVPFKNGGRDRQGCDCAGLVCLVYQELLGVDVGVDFGFYDSEDRYTAEQLIDAASVNWTEIEKPQDFDVVRLCIHGDPCHVGIICNGGKSILNVRAGVNAVIEPLYRDPWKRRTHSFWRREGLPVERYLIYV